MGSISCWMCNDRQNIELIFLLHSLFCREMFKESLQQIVWIQVFKQLRKQTKSIHLKYYWLYNRMRQESRNNHKSRYFEEKFMKNEQNWSSHFLGIITIIILFFLFFYFTFFWNISLFLLAILLIFDTNSKFKNGIEHGDSGKDGICDKEFKRTWKANYCKRNHKNVCMSSWFCCIWSNNAIL